MSGLRDEIRAILREEIAALTTGAQVAPVPARERVQIATSADLNRFAQDLVARAAMPGFAEQVARGEISFELAAQRPVGGPIVRGVPKAAPDVLDKPLVTERDIAALSRGARTLRLGKSSRLTPLARDEARRRGIRIERSET
ncbi:MULTISPECIES: hypothetical protein [unclassified Roseovarius]|uniref:hypothetical protein n=1 Tax=unclassified Roseovarius TaxID=2614913 RepID=UPI00273E4EEB|nr:MULTISPECIES: hypothetical protein [unclassified Roseovarius]